MFEKLMQRFKREPAVTVDEGNLMNTFSRLPVTFSRGEGAVLFDSEGEAYVDALGGIAVAILGHSHPVINEVVSLQASRLIHVSNLFHIAEQAELGKKFCQISQMDKVFFANSGAEANEAAIKLARKFGNDKGVDVPTIITANNSFHGRTMATLSATGNSGLKEGFEPLVADFVHVPYNDLDAIAAHAGNPSIVAVMIEPVQGEVGIIIPSEGYLRGIRDLCDANDWLMICDEIQTGMGRTGRWFAYQHEDILPDVMTSAKALANGIPIGACAARGQAAEILGPGSHGSTFGGNPFACKVASATIEVIEKDQLLEAAVSLSAFLKKSLQQQIGTHAKVEGIRAKGMMLAIELDQAYDGLAAKLLEQRLVANVTGGGRVIRLLPPLIMTEAQATQVVKSIAATLENLT